MSDAGPSDPVGMLVYALDEMRETTSLLPVAEVGRSLHRSPVRNLFFGFARSKAEVSAGLAVQYLAENVDRAREHWRDALTLLDDLQIVHRSNEVVAKLGEQLQAAGVSGVLGRLQHDAIPRPIAKTAVHLEAVVATIRDCEHFVLDARNTLTLERMRNEQ
jgi:hypothetical protein